MEVSEEFFWSQDDAVDLTSIAVGVLLWLGFPQSHCATPAAAGCSSSGAQHSSPALLSSHMS